MVCGVSRGDPPLQIHWLKDGSRLPPHLPINVSALDPYSSLLSIPSLTAAHSGEYTCVASNPASRVRYTAKLQVKGESMPTLLCILDVALAQGMHLRLGNPQVCFTRGNSHHLLFFSLSFSSFSLLSYLRISARCFSLSPNILSVA